MYQYHPSLHPQRLSDQTIAGACLDDCKFLAVRSTIAATECFNPELRASLATAAQENLQMAEEMFRWLSQRGFYAVPAANQQFVSQMSQQFAPISGRPF